MSLPHIFTAVGGFVQPVPLDPIPSGTVTARVAANGLTAKVREADEGGGVASASSSIKLEAIHSSANIFVVRVQGLSGRQNTLFSAWYNPAGAAQTLPFAPTTGQQIYTNNVVPTEVKFIQDGVDGGWLSLPRLGTQSVTVGASASVDGGQGINEDTDTRDIEIWLRADGYADTSLVTFKIEASARAQAYS